MQRVGKRLAARRASKGGAFPLAMRRNDADDCFPTRPAGATQMIQSCVAVLEKGYGHYLRTAPCLESSGSLCIRNYQVGGVQGARFSLRTSLYQLSLACIDAMSNLDKQTLAQTQKTRPIENDRPGVVARCRLDQACSNCSSSVDPASADREDAPALTVWVTASK